MILATWNVQGIRTKHAEVFREIGRFKIDICVITETKKKGNGTENVGDYIHLYSGVDKSIRAKRGVAIIIHKRFKNNIIGWEGIDERIITAELKINGHEIAIVGVYAPNDSDIKEIKDQFYEKLSAVIEQMRNKEICLLGDLNGRTGNAIDSPVLGRYGEAVRNENGERLIDLCESHSLKIMNGFFPHKDIHKFTYVQPTQHIRTIIDYYIQKKDSKLQTTDVRVYRGPECGSDHHLLGVKIMVRYRKHKIQGHNTKNNNEDKELLKSFNLDSLNHESVQFLYKLRIATKMQKANNIEQLNSEDLYQVVKTCIQEAAAEAVGYHEKAVQRTEWWNRDIEVKVREKKRLYEKWLQTNDIEDHRIYAHFNREVKRDVSKLKNETWEKKCEELERLIGGTRVSEAWKTIKNLRKNHRESRALQIITPEEWKEHYVSLLTENRDAFAVKKRTMKYDEEDNTIPITLGELKAVLRKMKNKKAPGPGNIPMELLKHATDALLEIIVCLFNKCLINGEKVPEDWNVAYISSIHKKGNRKLCKNYRGISVTSSMGRLYGKILKERIEHQILEMEEQSGFRAGRSCMDNIFVLRQVIEKRSARNWDTHLLFIDLEKAYDNVPLNKLMDTLDAAGIGKRYIRAINNIYEHTKGVIKLGKYLSDPFPITKGLRQGCCLSPTLFKIYVQEALKTWIKKCSGMGIEIGENCLFTLLFADDQVILANDEDDIEYMYRKLEEEFTTWGLKINLDKTEYLRVGGQAEDLQLAQGVIRSTQEFKYLGSIISAQGNSAKDIQHRVAQGRRCTQTLNSLLWSAKIKMKTKLMIYKAIVEPVLTYGAESWQITSKERNKIQAVEMDYLRRSCRVSKLQHIRNEEIRRRTGMEVTVNDRIDTRQLIWYGHVMRMTNERWPRRVLEYIPYGRRRRGRPATSWRQGVEKAMSSRELRDNEYMDRRSWRIKCGKRPRL